VLVYGENADDAGVAEASVLRSLRARRGIRVMDARSLGISGGDHAAIQSAVQGDFASLAELVRDQGGEFIFVGSLTSSARAAPPGPMFSGSAEFELRMYRVSTGEVLRSGIFSIGMAGQTAKMGISESGARGQAAEAAGTLGAIAARGWLALALR